MAQITIMGKNGVTRVVDETALAGATLPDGTSAGAVSAEIRNPANSLGLYTPARDVFAQWSFGQDQTFSNALVPATPTTGLAMDVRAVNTSARSVLIISASATNYDYEILAGRNNIVADAASILTGSAISTINTMINLPASLGFAPWLFLRLTNNSGNATYKAVLLGKGG